MNTDRVVETISIISENRYVQSIALFVFFLALAKLIFLVLNTWVLRLARTTPTSIDDQIIKRTEAAFCYIIVLFGMKLSLQSLHINDILFQRFINTVIIFILVYICSAIADIFIVILGQKMASHHRDFQEDLIPLFNNFSKVVIIIIALLITLEVWGIRVIPILAGLGVAGVIIGFAMKDSLANILGGISLILDKSFRIHDTVKLETGEVGEVIDIGLRSTKVKTLEDELLIIPNGVLANVKLINYAKPHHDLRIVCEIGVVYGSNPDKVEKVLLSSLKGVKGIEHEHPIEVRFVKMNEFSMDFQLLFYTEDYLERFKIKTDVMKNIYKNLKKNNIGIPFPTRTVYIKKEKKGKKR